MTKKRPYEKQFRTVWKNDLQKQVVYPLATFKPKSLEDVIAIIQEAEREGNKVKAVGSGYSFSDIAITQDYLINTHGLNKSLDIQRLSLKNEGSNINLAFVECGILVCDLNKLLDARHQALINMGGFTGQTIVGAISTSTHGSGITLESLAGFVEALIIVGEEGKVYHIEPSAGISSAVVKLGTVAIEFIQDDDVFYSSVVSVGSMGVVYALVLSVRDKYNLQENRSFSTWNAVKHLLQKEEGLRQYRHLEVLINTYPKSKHNENSCLITTRWEHKGKLPFEWYRRHRNWIYEIIGFLLPDFVIHRIMLFLFNTFSKRTPRILELFLQALKDGEYTNKSYKVLDIGKANNISAYSMEIAFPKNQYMAAVDKIIALTKDLAENYQLYLTSPIALRFVKCSKHYLAMQYSEQADDNFVCMVEFPIINGTKGGVEILQRIESAMYAFGGVPHWGQLNHVGMKNARMSKLYPKFQGWMSVYERFCAKGTFQNDFTERIGLFVPEKTMEKEPALAH